MMFISPDKISNNISAVETLEAAPPTPLPVSVIVCTLNEEENIGDCLQSIRTNIPAEILVIDGCSVDKTVSIATQAEVTVYVCDRKGLAYQRYVGVERASQPYVAFIDADDRLSPTALAVSLTELLDNEWAAIAIQSGPFQPMSYWERAMGFLDEAYHNTPGPTIMVGRPALYEKATLLTVGIDQHWGVGIGNEDTDLSIRYEQSNLPMGIGTGKSLRRHPASFRASMKTWIKYGKGDAKIAIKHPHKKKNILSQLHKKYFGTLTQCAIKKKRWDYLPFIWLMGLTRFSVAVWFLRTIQDRTYAS